MIVIEKVTCKNFLSYGNAVTEFDLARHKATLIRGKNGHGKSVILDLLLYALYGKPYRSINKPQLINSVNRADMLVEVHFRIAATEYLVRRGMKPNVFDIFKDGQLVDQDAAIKDYQEFLENQILKIPERTFKQIAVLGSASYVPFMKLMAHQRRELVESILDIEVFSRMNNVLKERIASSKEEFSRITYTLDAKKNEAVAQQKLILVIEKNTHQRVEEHTQKKDSITASIAEAQRNLKAVEYQIGLLVEPTFDINAYNDTSSKEKNSRLEINTLIKKRANMKPSDGCPTCLQKVSEEHVHHVQEHMLADINSLVVKHEQLKSELAQLEIAKTNWDEYAVELNNLNDCSTEYIEVISNLQDDLIATNKTIIDILADNSNLEEERTKLKTIASDARKLIERKNVLSEEKHIQEVCQQLLKDTGVKTAVVREYLPILNQLINKYLAMFDFFVDFTLDESFEEVIKSRGRDVFSYSSFSEGEKRRIDFAILMAFRQLAALKNSAKTNILILDEIVDGAFDLEARSAFNDLLANIPHSNVIVISHADASTEQYDRVIQVEKQGDFSTYSVVE